jgi:hypothetical protein
MFDTDNPLNRILGESKQANKALMDYAEMGGRRSIRDLFEFYSKQKLSENQADNPPTGKISTLWTWSARHKWQERVARFDEIEKREREQKRIQEREERRRLLEEADWEDGQQLRQRVLEFLEELPKFLKTSEQTKVEEVIDKVTGQSIKQVTKVIVTKLNTSLPQLAQAMKVASELQRMATDSPTSRTEHTESGEVSDARERLISKLDSIAERIRQKDNP